MLTIAIQDVLVPHREVVRDIDACRSMGIEPVRFGLIPFTDTISTDNPEDLTRPAVPFGSVKLIRLWQQGKTPAGWRVFYDDAKFDQRVWGERLGKLALNDAKRCTELGVLIDERWREPVFIKPTNDLKAFAGMVVEVGQTIRERLAEATQDSSLSERQPILWAPYREIDREYRCYMRGHTMIEASRYKTGPQADHKPVTDLERSNLRIFANEVAQHCAPAIFYALDIAVLPDETMRVVEYNCINCSGRYTIDRAKLFRAMLGP